MRASPAQQGLYGDGQGVRQDYAMAHMWFNLAAASADKTAAEARGGLSVRNGQLNYLKFIDFTQAARIRCLCTSFHSFSGDQP
jgi:TPR repeat protein